MPRNVSTSIENNFTRGLITEASGLNFPENACTDTVNCHFEVTGEVRRRLGIDFEASHSVKTLDKTGAAITSYLWKNVGGDGNIALWVVQVGDHLYFYNAAESASLSANALTTSVDLTDFMPASAPSPKTVECQFSDGLGYLFVTHPTLESFYVAFNTTTSVATATQIDLSIRDFVGIAPPSIAPSRSSSLSDSDKYNLANQGWSFSEYTPQTSSTAITPAASNKTFTVTASGPWVAGDPIYIYSKRGKVGTEDRLAYMRGTVVSYSGTTLVINPASFQEGNTSPCSDWTIVSDMDYQHIFKQAMSFYPSDTDVWWLFKDANDEFNPAKTAANINRGDTPAPKGHYVLNVYDEDRSDASGIAGITVVSTGYERVSTSAFFSGRAFYAGIAVSGYSSNIYFTRILKSGETAKFGDCYQASDPTSETLYDLLPNDGGVIAIPEAGTIIKLWSMQGGLVVFASNGIWQITGSTGIGFTATDYTVRQISSIKAISHTSFVNLGGFPSWWSSEGVYVLTPDASGQNVTIKSMTDETLLTFYQTIPGSSKKQARGYFDLITKKIQWVYRSTQAGDIDEIYEYDSALVFNTRTASWSPWTFAEGDVKIHGIVVVDSAGGATSENTVIDNALNTVIDDAGNTVVSYSLSSETVPPVFKYLASYASGSADIFTVLEERGTEYMDYYEYDGVGVDYDSYFISGYRLRGQGIRKFQANYVYLFNNAVPSEYYFQAIWDYANTGDSGSWSSQAHQVISVAEDDYDIKRRRLKIRGEGLALQFKVSSASGQPFSLVGWASSESANAAP